LLDVKRTAFIQVPEQASAKFHLMDEVTGDSFYPRLLAVYPDISFHGMKDFGFARGWVKAWTGREVQLYEVTSALPIVEMKCVRQHFEQALASDRILICLVE
jgi:hypothetical protein